MKKIESDIILEDQKDDFFIEFDKQKNFEYYFN